MTLGSNGSLNTQVDGDVSTLQDVSYYKFTTLSLGDFQVQLQTSGFSTLMSRLTVYNVFGKKLGTIAAPDPFHGDLTVTVPNLLPLSTYYLKVESASSDVFGIGGYHLQVQTLPLVNLVTTTAVGLVNNLSTTLVNDLPLNSTPLTALLLGQQFSRPTPISIMPTVPVSHHAGEVEYFHLTAPVPPAGQPNVMEVMVWGQGHNGLLPALTVYDSKRKVVASTVIVGTERDVGAVPCQRRTGGQLLFESRRREPVWPRNLGNYFLGVDFTTQAVQLQNFATGTLTPTNMQLANTVTVNQTALFHFVLSANTGNAADAAAVRMTIYNGTGQVVFTLVAHNQETTSSMFICRWAPTSCASRRHSQRNPLAGLDLCGEWPTHQRSDWCEARRSHNDPSDPPPPADPPPSDPSTDPSPGLRYRFVVVARTTSMIPKARIAVERLGATR